MKVEFKKIFGDILNKKTIYILGAVGILLLFLSSFSAYGEKEEVVLPEKDYCSLLEEKLERILPEINKVGQVKVMVTAKNYGEVKLAKDNESEGEKTIILNQKGGGEDTKTVEKTYPEIQGVIVVADGGGISSVKEAVTEAVCALLGVDAHKIRVYERKL